MAHQNALRKYKRLDHVEAFHFVLMDLCLINLEYPMHPFFEE